MPRLRGGTRWQLSKGVPARRPTSGSLNQNGNGMLQDYSKAERWYLMAAEQGDDKAAGYLKGLLQKQHQQPEGVSSKKGQERLCIRGQGVR